MGTDEGFVVYYTLGFEPDIVCTVSVLCVWHRVYKDLVQCTNYSISMRPLIEPVSTVNNPYLLVRY